MSRRIFLAAVLGIACAIAPVSAEAQYYGTTNVANGKPVSPVSTPATVNDGKGDLLAPWFAGAFTIDLGAEVLIGKIVLSVQQVNLLVISSSLDGVTFVERHRLNMTDPQHANWPDAQANGALVFEADGTYSARYLRYQAFDVGCGCWQLLKEFAVYEWVATPPPVLSGNNLATGRLVTDRAASASPPTNVADGNPDTSWVGASVYAYTTARRLYWVYGWAQVDLAADRSIHGVRVRRPTTGGAQSVLISLFNSGGTEVGWFGDGDPSLMGTDIPAFGDVDFVIDAPVQARYIRIFQTNPTVSSPYVRPALAEVEVYGEVVGSPADIDSPTTGNNAPSTWQKADFTVTLACTDNDGGSGCKETKYRIDLGAWQTGNSISISTEGDHLIEYYSVDNAGNQESTKSTHAKLDKTAPTMSAGQSPPPNGAGWNNTDVTVSWNWSDTGGSGIDAANCTASSASSGEGTIVLNASCNDRAGNTRIAYYTVMVDKTAPTISGLPAPGTCTLWPPNHKLVQVATVTVSDGLSGPGSLSVTGSSNEPENGLGDGDTAPDIVINGGTVQLRAERSGEGNGRLYTLTAAATDLAGNIGSAAASCAVPHDQAKK